MRLLLLGLLLCTAAVEAEDRLTVYPGEDAGEIGQNLEYMVEESPLSIDSVQEAEFRPSIHDSFNIGIQPTPVWLRLRLRNGSERSGEWVLATNKALFESFDVYEVTKGAARRSFSYADPMARAAMYHRYQTVAFPIRLGPHQQLDLYVRFRAPTTSMPIALLTPETQAKHASQKLFLYLAVLTGLVSLIVFTVLPLLAAGMRTFLLYAAAQLCLFVFVFHMDGLTTALLWPDRPEFGRYFASQSSTAYELCLVLFSRSFFGTAQRSPRLDRGLRAVAWIGIFYLVYSLLGYAITDLDLRWTTVPAIIVNLTAWLVLPALSVYGTIRWNINYWPIAMAWVFITLFAFGVLLIVTGFVPHPPFARYYYAFAIVLEAVSLWAALMLRVKEVRDENRAMHEDLNRSLALQIEETKRSQALAREKSAALLDASEKSRLLLAAGHDARQTVAALRSFAFGLRRSEQPRVGEQLDDLAQYLDAVLTTAIEGSYSGALTDSITAIEWVDVGQLFTTLRLIHAQHAFSKNLKFRLRATSARIPTDRVLLSRILGNYVSNAIKYTQEGGVLIVHRARRNADSIQVWDTGIGLTPEQLGKIQDAKGLKRFTPEEDGIGAGLGIASELARRLDIGTRVRSRPGVGSVFELVFSRSPPRVPQMIAVADNGTSPFGAGIPERCCTPRQIEDGDLPAVAPETTFLIDGDDSPAMVSEFIRRQYPAACIVAATFDRSMEHRSRIAALCDSIVYKPFDETCLNVAAARAAIR